MARPMRPMTARIENVIRADARGEPHDKILSEFFGITAESTPKERNRAEQQLYRWRHRPDAKAIWDDEISATVRKGLPGALSTLLKQVASKEGWLANKASNDILNLCKTVGIVNTAETAVNIQVQGMPDLGSPEQDER